jgi:hypothetical protein
VAEERPLPRYVEDEFEAYPSASARCIRVLHPSRPIAEPASATNSHTKVIYSTALLGTAITSIRAPAREELDSKLGITSRRWIQDEPPPLAMS